MLELPHLLILIALELGHSKLLSVQGKPKKKLERKKRRLFIVSSIIVDAITNFTIGERDWNVKMEMKKFITFQMLQSEENGRQMIIQGQGENTLQVNQLSPKKVMYN